MLFEMKCKLVIVLAFLNVMSYEHTFVCMKRHFKTFYRCPYMGTLDENNGNNRTDVHSESRTSPYNWYFMFFMT